ncbi:hypothetical protein L2E82_23124 [Cichorium intybus]|uniref:Uncharacterized protein n=1 Tax=Cichorium intybus TaxID=13427 RepID=A0ACB9DZA5_CICIN|nr:hypothetical protein L2E82_23124 [Cichorium intybus]
MCFCFTYIDIGASNFILLLSRFLLSRWKRVTEPKLKVGLNRTHGFKPAKPRTHITHGSIEADEHEKKIANYRYTTQKRI